MPNIVIFLNLAASLVSTAWAMVALIRPGSLSGSRHVERGEIFYVRMYAVRSTLARPHAVLGYNKMRYNWDFSGGEAEFRRAVELDPSDATAPQWLSETLSYIGGQGPRSIAEANRARVLDPLSAIIAFQQAQAYSLDRQFDKATELYTKVIADNPTFALVHWGLARMYWAEHLYPLAAKEFGVAAAFRGNKNDSYEGALEAGFQSGGWPAALRRAIEVALPRLKANGVGGSASLFEIAECYADLGEKDHAFEWLYVAYQEHGHLLYGLRTSAALDSLHSDPRYTELVRKIGLPPL